MFDFIKPQDRAKYFALGLLIIVVVSSAALYMNSGNQVSSGIGAPSDSGTDNNSIDTFNGTVASANATLLSWDPSLVVLGDNAQMDALVQNLKAQGVVLYSTPNADGSTTLRLSDSSQVFALSAQLMALNLSVYDEGVISIPEVHVVGTGIEADVPGTTFRYNTEPTINEGDTVPMSFDADVVDGQLAGLGNIAFLPSAPVSAIIAPLNASINASFWRLSIPWSERDLNSNQFESDLPGGSQVLYSPKSYVTFDPALTTAQLSALQAKMPAYAQSSLTPTLMGVDLNMTDEGQVQSDLAAEGINATFPNSTMDIYAYQGPNETDAQWLLSTQDTFNQSFPGVVVDFVPTWRLVLALPAVIGSGNDTYVLENTTLTLNSLYPPMDNGTLKAIFSPVGREVTQFSQAEYSPGLEGFLFNGEDIGAAADNGTGDIAPSPMPQPSSLGNAPGAGAQSGVGGLVVTDENGNVVPIMPVTNGTNDTGGDNGS